MKKISTENIHPDGHIIAVDVIGAAGNVLISKGAKITPALGRRIRNWGVEYIFIEGEDDDADRIKVNAKSPQEIYNDLYEMFTGTLENAHMKVIFDAVYAHKTKDHNSGKGG